MRVCVPAILVLTFCAVLLAASTPAGEVGPCPPVAGSGAAPYPAPSTPDALVANFERAINEMNLEAYAALLHGDFEFVFAPRDRHRVAPDTSWNRAEELMSMERLFSGEPGTNRFGRRVPGVKGIEFALVAADDWTYASAEVETWDRTYHAFAKIFFEDGTRRVIARQQIFTLTAQRNEWDLSPVEFRLLRWEEVGCDCPTGGPTGGPPLMAKSRY